MASIYIKLLLMAAIWGGTFIAGKNLAQSVGPYTGAFLRYTVACVFLVVFMLRAGEKPVRLSWRNRVVIFCMGMTGIVGYNVFFLKGLKLIEAGRASIIIANNPILIALLSAVFFGERLNGLKVFGIALSVTGAVLAITRGDLSFLLRGGFGWGEINILGCVASWVAFTLLGKKAMSQLSPLSVVTYSSLAGAACLFPAAWAEGLWTAWPYSAADWANAFFLGFFGTVLAFVWYYQGIQRIGPARAGLFINFVPLFAILLAYLLLGEPLTASLATGALLVSSGVYLTTLGSRRA
jgi:drug/metabolite transporter (DMT)-like permease